MQRKIREVITTKFTDWTIEITSINHLNTKTPKYWIHLNTGVSEYGCPLYLQKYA